MGLWRRINAIIHEISKELQNNLVKEENLKRLEILEEILREEGSEIPESLKEAYRRIAMECTVRCLLCGEDSRRSFIEAIRRIWTKRVMALCDKDSSLVTRELKDDCGILKLALTDEKVCGTLLEDRTKNKPLVSLKKLLSELHRDLGDSANSESPDEAGEGDNSSNRSNTSEDEGKGKEIVLFSSQREAGEGENSGNSSNALEDESKGKEIVLVNALPELMPGHEQLNSPLRNSNGGELNAEHSRPSFKSISTPVFDRVLNDLKASKDDMVKALQQARDCGLNDENKKQKIVVPNLSAQEGAFKTNLMARNSTAQTYEWEDSIDDSTGESNGDGEKTYISKRKRMVRFPLNKDDASKGPKREKIRWTTAETQAILRGYEIHGPNWKLIKEENPILARRTNVNIKDKFRVEMRRQEAYGYVRTD